MPNANDPSRLGLTYRDLIITASRELRAPFHDESGEPIPPPINGARDVLRRCETVIARAVRWLVGQVPDWSWLRQTATVTWVAGTDAYDMPWWFGGQVMGPFTYGSDGPARIIEIVSMADLDRMRSGSSSTQQGEPVAAAFRHKQPDEAVSASRQPHRMEVVFWPAPSSELTVSIAARAYPLAMCDNQDRFFAGEELNAALEAAVMFEAASEIMSERAGERQQRRGEMTDAARKLEMSSRARDLGTLERTVGDDPWNSRLIRTSVDRSNGLTYYEGNLIT